MKIKKLINKLRSNEVDMEKAIENAMANIPEIQEEGNPPFLFLLKKIKEVRVDHWYSQGSNGGDYVEYKIHNGAFTYHKNKKRVRFPLKSQRYCAEQSWGPEGQLEYYDALEIAMKMVEEVDLSATDSYRNTPLHIACQIGEPDLVEAIMGKITEIDLPNKEGETPLHKMAESNRVDGMKAFVKAGKGKDINFKAQDNSGWTALHHSIVAGDESEMVTFLLKKKIDATLLSTVVKKEIEKDTSVATLANSLDRESASLFKTEITVEDAVKAIEKGNKTEVEKFLQNGGDVEAADENANLLIHAVNKEQASIVELLLSKGANPNAVYHSNINGLMLNVINLYQKGQYIPEGAKGEYMEHVKIAEAFINRGVDLSITREGDNQTALRVAADISDDITHMILQKLEEYDNKAEIINTRDSEGFTALHMASKRGKVKILDKLIALGADVSLGDNDDFIPLHEGIIAGEYEAVKFLVEKGSDIKHKITGGYSYYESGDNAVDMAKKKGDERMIALFENN